MSTWKPRARRRTFQPSAEGLETRELLTSMSTRGSTISPFPALKQPVTAEVSGTDIDGDYWTLKLYGPGTLNVADGSGNSFTKDTRTIPDSIDTITVGGAISAETRLVGKVHKASTGDGKVFFQNLNVTSSGQFAKLDPNDTLNNRLTQNGIAAIDMPQFYLGHTSTTAPSVASTLHTTFMNAGEISIPGGVNTLRFGGVDTTYTVPGGVALNTDGQNDEFVVNLGVPVAYGTSIIVNNVTTDAQAATSSTTSATQKSVTFLAGGRLNLFQANEIDGNTTTGLVPTQFVPGSTTNLPGGTYVISEGEAVTGAIGFLRVGGNATNLTAFAISDDVAAAPVDSDTDPKVSNFYIGQETNNVILIAPGGSRDIYFGRGMDNVWINSLLISNLSANRGAVNSNVTVTRSIGDAVFGGDVVDTNIQAGYSQTLATQADLISTNLSTPEGVFYGQPVATIANRVADSTNTLIPIAHAAGSIKIRVAGNVTNSVISASVDPNPSGINEPGIFSNVTTKTFPFGTPENLVLRGSINAKVEGNIDNSANGLVSADAPANKAFFAKTVTYSHGPVIPPNVVESPLGPTKRNRGQGFLTGLNAVDHTKKK